MYYVCIYIYIYIYVYIGMLYTICSILYTIMQEAEILRRLLPCNFADPLPCKSRACW